MMMPAALPIGDAFRAAPGSIRDGFGASSVRGCFRGPFRASVADAFRVHLPLIGSAFRGLVCLSSFYIRSNTATGAVAFDPVTLRGGRWCFRSATDPAGRRWLHSSGSGPALAPGLLLASIGGVSSWAASACGPLFGSCAAAPVGRIHSAGGALLLLGVVCPAVAGAVLRSA